MRQSLLSSFALLLILFLSVSFFPASSLSSDEPPELSLSAVQQSQQTDQSDPSTQADQSVQTSGWDAAQTIHVLTEDGNTEMALSDYLWGVLAAEMPASFPSEALKAQAAAARTNVIYRLAHPSSSHPDAQVCTDYHCCQAYLSPAAAVDQWGVDAQTYADRIREAVSATDGLVVCYDGAPIQAVFFSSAAGHTLASDEVWSTSLPYLQPVTSPEDDTMVPNYYSVVTVSTEEFRTILLTAHPEADLSGDPSVWVGDMTYTSSGVPQSLTVGGAVLSATELRTLFSLRSAVFSLSYSGNGFTFSVTGYGHGVGMSQYGAKALAEQGADFSAILGWYYTGTAVTSADSLTERIE